MSKTSVAVVILAGGEATRFPRKLERPLRGTPLLLTVVRNFQAAFPVYISIRDGLPPALEKAVHAPTIADRYPGIGPLGGLATAAETIDAEKLFAVAGDAPAVNAEVLETLLSVWRKGDEAAVPEHEGRLEPLAALYDRTALLRETSTAIAGGQYSLHTLLEHLAVRHVSMSAAFFLNINTAADLARIDGRRVES